MEAQRAPAYRLCSELSRGALEGRGVLARQSGHRCHHGLQLGTSLPAPRTTEGGCAGAQGLAFPAPFSICHLHACDGGVLLIPFCT